MKRMAIAASTLLLLASGVVSCSNPQSSGNSATENGGTQEASLNTVGATLGDLGNPFYVSLQRGIESKAKELGGDSVKVTTVSSAFDLNQQANQIENFAAAGTDLIILSAVDPEGVRPAITQARESGKIVIGVDSTVNADVDAMISSNNTQAGEVACQYIADQLQGQGNVVILNGTQMDSIIQRVSGCTSVLAKYPGINILSQDQNAEGTRDGGLRVMSDLLTTFPQIDAVFATNDQSGIGADLAASQAQRDEFFIVGIDGSPEAIESMENENSLFVATAAQDPAGMGAKAVEVGNDILKGNRPSEPNILMPVQLVTRETLSSYEGW